MAISADTLLDETKCFACYNFTIAQLLKLGLYIRQLQALDPAADVSPQALVEYGKCYACLGISLYDTILLSLLDQIVAAGGGSGTCSNLEGIASPLNSVTPDFIGQVYVQSDGTIWQAGSLLSSSWVVIGNNLILTTPTGLGGTLGLYEYTPNGGIVNLVWNAVGDSDGGISFYADSVMESFSAPFLTSVDLNADNSAYFYFDSLTALTVVDFPVLATATYINITGCSSLTSLSLPSFTANTIANVAINGNSALTTVSLPIWLPKNGQGIAFSGNALTAASVNHILARCVAAGVTTCPIDLSGGTNAAPTGQGIIDKAALILAGNTVLTN